MTVSLHELTIRYGRILAVDRISVEFPSGAAGLLGRNGAGKSSVLRALLGLVRPASGTMLVGGLAADAGPAEVRRFVGYMPERDTHIPLLNGYETVRLAAQLSGLPRLDGTGINWFGLRFCMPRHLGLEKSPIVFLKCIDILGVFGTVIKIKRVRGSRWGCGGGVLLIKRKL